jgi:hypothetical protein
MAGITSWARLIRLDKRQCVMPAVGDFSRGELFMQEEIAAALITDEDRSSAHSSAFTPGQCASCGETLTGRYCHRCGQKQFTKHDLSLKEVFEELVHEILHVDSKIFRTFRYLVTRPGFLTAEYLAGRTNFYIKPLRIYLTISVLSFLILSGIKSSALFNAEFYTRASPQLSAQIDRKAEKLQIPREVLLQRITEKIQKNYSLLKYGIVFFMSLWLWLIYARSGKYYSEHLIFALHYISFLLLMEIPIYPLMGINQTSGQVLSLLIHLPWVFLAIRRVFGHSNFGAAIRSVVICAGFMALNTAVFWISLVRALRAVFDDTAH